VSFERLAVTVVINSTPSAPTGIAAQEFCGASTVEDLEATGDNIKWYNANGDVLTANTVLVDGAKYYASQTINACESPATFEVTVTVNTTPMPSASAQAFCNAATVAELIATGTDLNWYDAETGGDALTATTALSTGTYYVTQTLSNCASARLAVEVTVNTTAAPTGIAQQAFCNAATVAQLAASGQNITWYGSLTSTIALASTEALVSGNTYYATQAISNCESANRLAVFVTVTPAQDVTLNLETASGDALERVCLDLGSVQLAGGLPVGGVYAGNGVTGGVFSTDNLTAGTYEITYTYTLNNCSWSATDVIEVDECLTVKDNKNAAVNMYPNPAVDKVNVTWDSNAVEMITVLDLTGRVMIKQSTDKLSGHANVDINNLPQGIYFVKLTGVSFTKDIKLIKK
jgi:hypothetical protein